MNNNKSKQKNGKRAMAKRALIEKSKAKKENAKKDTAFLQFTLKSWSTEENVLVYSKSSNIISSLRLDSMTDDKSFYDFDFLDEEEMDFVESYVKKNLPKTAESSVASFYKAISASHEYLTSSDSSKLSLDNLIMRRHIDRGIDLHHKIAMYEWDLRFKFNREKELFVKDEKFKSKVFKFLAYQYYLNRRTTDDYQTLYMLSSSNPNMAKVDKYLININSEIMAQDKVDSNCYTYEFLTNNTKILFITNDLKSSAFEGVKINGEDTDNNIAFYYPVSPTQALKITPANSDHWYERMVDESEAILLNSSMKKSYHEYVYSKNRQELEDLVK